MIDLTQQIIRAPIHREVNINDYLEIEVDSNHFVFCSGYQKNEEGISFKGFSWDRYEKQNTCHIKMVSNKEFLVIKGTYKWRSLKDEKRLAFVNKQISSKQPADWR